MDHGTGPRVQWGDPLRDALNVVGGLNAQQAEDVRRIVCEEIVRALQAMGREADHRDMPYETAEIDSRALSNIRTVAEGAVSRITCEHERVALYYGELRCTSCGEPEPVPANPFEETTND